MTPRKLLLWIHLVSGLAAAIVLILLGASGAVLVFESEIEHSLNASLYRVQPKGQPLPLDALVGMVEQQARGAEARVISLSLSSKENIAYSMTMKSARGPSFSVTNPPQEVRPLPLLESAPQPSPISALKLERGATFGVTVDPYTGNIVGELNKANPLLQKVHQFHKNLLAPGLGNIITGAGAILLVLLALTGLVLWWPRKLWSFGSAKATGRLSFDLHNFLGFYSSVFMLLFGVTGIVIHWDAEAMKLVSQISGQPVPQPAPKPSSVPPGSQPLAPDTILAIANKTVPGARVTSMQNLHSLTGAIRVTMRFPEDRTPAGRTNVYLHPTTGDVLLAQTSRNAAAPYRLVKLWNRQLHTGDAFGWPTRIVAAIASASLPLLAVTGPLIWWSRIRRKRRATP